MTRAAMIREALQILGPDATLEGVRTHVGQKHKGVLVPPTQFYHLRKQLREQLEQENGEEEDDGIELTPEAEHQLLVRENERLERENQTLRMALQGLSATVSMLTGQ